MSRIVDYPLETLAPKFNLTTEKEIEELWQMIISEKHNHYVLYRIMSTRAVFEQDVISVSYKGQTFYFKNRFGMPGLYPFDEKSEKIA